MNEKFFQLGIGETKSTLWKKPKNILLEMNLEKETKVLIGLHINMVI